MDTSLTNETVQAMVLVPTRELALQTSSIFKELSNNLSIGIAFIKYAYKLHLIILRGNGINWRNFFEVRYLQTLQPGSCYCWNAGKDTRPCEEANS